MHGITIRTYIGSVIITHKNHMSKLLKFDVGNVTWIDYIHTIKLLVAVNFIVCGSLLYSLELVRVCGVNQGKPQQVCQIKINTFNHRKTLKYVCSSCKVEIYVDIMKTLYLSHSPKSCFCFDYVVYPILCIVTSLSNIKLYTIKIKT